MSDSGKHVYGLYQLDTTVMVWRLVMSSNDYDSLKEVADTLEALTSIRSDWRGEYNDIPVSPNV